MLNIVMFIIVMVIMAIGCNWVQLGAIGSSLAVGANIQS